MRNHIFDPPLYHPDAFALDSLTPLDPEPAALDPFYHAFMPAHVQKEAAAQLQDRAWDDGLWRRQSFSDASTASLFLSADDYSSDSPLDTPLLRRDDDAWSAQYDWSRLDDAPDDPEAAPVAAPAPAAAAALWTVDSAR
jgi:hypothetical protein